MELLSQEGKICKSVFDYNSQCPLFRRRKRGSTYAAAAAEVAAARADEAEAMEDAWAARADETDACEAEMSDWLVNAAPWEAELLDERALTEDDLAATDAFLDDSERCCDASRRERLDRRRASARWAEVMPHVARLARAFLARAPPAGAAGEYPIAAAEATEAAARKAATVLKSILKVVKKGRGLDGW